MTAYNQGRPFGASFDYGQPLPYLHHTAPAPSFEHQPQQRQQQQQRGMMYGGQRGHMHHTTHYPTSQVSSAYASPNAYYDASQQQMAGQQYQHQPPQQQQQLFQQQQHAYQAYPHQQLQQRQHQLDLGHAHALSAAPSASSGLYAGAAQAVPNFAGGAQAACSGYTADLRTIPTEQQHHQHSHWPSSAYGHNHNPLVGYGQTAQLSLPPVLPAPHQGAGLRPALNLEGLGNGQTQSRRSSREFMRTHHHHHQQQQQQQYVDGPAGFTYSQGEVAIEAPLPISAMRQVDAYHHSLPPHMVNAHQQAQYATVPSHMWGSFVQQEANGNTYAPMQAELAMPQEEVTLADEPQLIAPDASAIPPPPPIEKSAYPLAALATDLVWDAFLSAASHNSGLGSSPSMPSSGAASPIHQSHFRDADMQQGHASSPLTASRPRQGRSLSPQVARTDRHGSAEVCESSSQANAGNVYGAIGGERKPRPSNLATSVSPGSRSDSSSPASTAPGTPATEASVQCLVKTGSDNSLGSRMQSRFTGASIGTPFWGEDSHSEQVNHSKDMLFSLSGPSMNHLRSSAPYGNHSRYMQDLSPPAALFEQIQKLLGATLLSQQVLLLALYFVGKTPHTSALYPPATSQSALKSTSAPFKLLLAALVVANKHLDDNSFRNSTFAQVANVTLPEVNALEYSMLAGLEFDVNVSAGDWLAWLQNLQYSRVTTFTPEPSRVEDIIGHMLVDAHQQSQDHENRFGFRADVVLESSFSRSEAASPAHRPRQLDHATVMDVPVVPLSPAPSDMSSLVSGGTFDMDASGPLEREQRPRYAKAFDAGTSKVPSPHQYGLGVFGGAYRPITVA